MKINWNRSDSLVESIIGEPYSIRDGFRLRLSKRGIKNGIPGKGYVIVDIISPASSHKEKVLTKRGKCVKISISELEKIVNEARRYF